MVLESIINPFTAEKKPWEMFFIGLLYCSAAIVLSLWIFKQYASLVMVFLTVMACIPLVYSTMKYEEKKDIKLNSEKSLLKEHGKALSFLVFLFLGMVIAFTAWYIFLPSSISQNLFQVQTQTIVTINNNVTGGFLNQFNLLGKIFLNNIRVLVFCVLFAFIFGAGAIFILTWNASVIGAAMGNFIRSGLGNHSNYFYTASLGFFRYAIHGLPEIAAYFVAGMAGGIISIAVINHDFRTKNFSKILTDSADLILISVLFLVVAALLEVFVTPLLYA